MIDLPKMKGRSDGNAPGWFLALRPDGWTVVVACANRHYAYIPNHEVQPDGRVKPSLICPERGCGWHESVRLVDWEKLP